LLTVPWLNSTVRIYTEQPECIYFREHFTNPWQNSSYMAGCMDIVDKGAEQCLSAVAPDTIL